MSEAIFAATGWSLLPWQEPWLWALVSGVCALGLLLPGVSVRAHWLGGLLGLVSLGLLFAALPGLQNLFSNIVFYLLAGITVAAAVATISTRSPVYAAIWFAISLLATGGLLLFQGAQFLGLATIVVYAGAIVVTFLFVVMLAQPEGHASYDRISWSGFAKPMALVAAGALVIMTTYSVTTFVRQTRSPARDDVARSVLAAQRLAAAPPTRAVADSPRQVLHNQHMASFGAELFARHLVSVEITGTLLLVALVGAIAIVLNERPPSATRGETDHA